MATSQPDNQEREQLAALQAELQALKAHIGRALRLQRSTPADASSTAPFPIVLTFEVEPPPEAVAHYDVSAVRIQIRLNQEALRLPQLAAGSEGGVGATHGPLPASPPGTALAVLSDELPQVLRNRMAQELSLEWLRAMGLPPAVGISGPLVAGAKREAVGSVMSTGPYKLSSAAAYLKERFVPLICLVPELVEAYQSEDQHGATVRRYTIINNDGLEGEADVGTGAAPPTGVAAAGIGGEGAKIKEVVGATAYAPGGGGSSSGMAGAPARAIALPGLQDTASGSAGATTSSKAVAPEPCGACPAADGRVQTTSSGDTSTGHAPAAAPSSSCEQQEQRHPQSDPHLPSRTPHDARAAGAAVRDGEAATESTAPVSMAQPQSPEPMTAAAAPPPQLPPGLLSYDVTLKELQYIQKRYSQVFSVRVHHDGPDAGARGGGGGPQTLLQPGCLTTFDLELLPTDPDWDHPPVRVVGQLLPISAAAYLPSLGVHMASRLSPWLRGALEGYMAQQLAAEAEAALAAERAAAAAEAEAAARNAAQQAAEAEEAAAASIVAAASGVPPAAEAETERPRGAAVRSDQGTRGGRGRDGGRGQGFGGQRGGGGRGPAGGPSSGGTVKQRVVAPEGTVLLPAGVLRNLFRDLENYAGGIARAADEDRQRREREQAGAAGGAFSDGSSGAYSSDDEGELRYDDDGYGDGSLRRDDDAVAAPGEAAGPDEYDSDGGGGDDDGGAAADEVRFSGAAAAGSTDLPAAYAVILEGLQLDNLAVVEVLRANFEVSCVRCGGRGTMFVASSAVAGGSGASQQVAAAVCPQCTAPWSLMMRPHYVHATCNSLCVVKPQGCMPLDLLPSMMAGQCGECSAVMSLREVQVGMPFTRTCSSCHKELLLSVAAVSFIPRGPPAASRGGAARAAARRPRGDAAGAGGGGGGAGVLRPGQPLPALGTCKHYRHSYRLLRFPCCGMRFPCDLCHEEAVPDGHPVRWAQRMVCGFCSTEQPVALGCKACGRQLAGSAANPSGRRTRFWEGGTGCRDARRLNKNDPHKWRGRSKTQSAKASRVGPKPWSGKGGGASAGLG